MSKEADSSTIDHTMNPFCYTAPHPPLSVSFTLVNKQINDKERIAAAMENPNLRTLVEDCIKEED